MKKNIILLIMVSIITSFFSCKDDDISENLKVNLLYIEESKQVWDGKSANQFINIVPSNNVDTTLLISTKLYKNYKGGKDDVSFEISIDRDSLNVAISKSAESKYSIYKNAKELPDKYYKLSKNSLILEADKDVVEASITINKEELLKDNYITKSGSTYIIPIKLVNASGYKINPTTSILMYILKFPESQLDLTKPDPSEAPDIEGYNLFWSDEFNYEGKPDSKNWTAENGFVRNQELQWYQADNAQVTGGRLVITGKKEKVLNPNFESGSGDWKKNRQYAEYTSTSLGTAGKVHFKFGRIEIRAKIPTVMGAWPAIWTLGESMEWPSSGEIDILEYYLSGGEPYIHCNFAWGKDARWEANWNSYKKPFSDFTKEDPDWSSRYHVWRMDWDSDKTYFYIDDVLLREVWTNSMWNGSYGNWTNPFHQPHYILLNLALGGNGGDPSDTKFPIQYEVDYVRIYQKK